MENKSPGKLSRASGGSSVPARGSSSFIRKRVHVIYNDGAHSTNLTKRRRRGRTFFGKEEEKFSRSMPRTHAAHPEKPRADAIETRRQCVTFRPLSSAESARARTSAGHNARHYDTRGKRIWESFHGASGA